MIMQRGPGNQGGDRGGKAPQGPRGGPMAGMVPGEKAKDFKGSMGRLLKYLRPVIPHILAVLLMAAISVVFTVLTPSLMGDATDILMKGFLAGMQSAAMGGPASGFIDFSGLLSVLLKMGVLYGVSALFGFLQGWIMSGVARRVVYDLRRDIDAKLDRLPLKYFDDTPRGQILARVTGDVDNIASTLQQNIMQVVTSVFTLIGVLIMMFGKSWQLTLICMLTVPIVMTFSMIVMKRSKKHFTAQWAANGALTGQIEEMYTGHNIVRAYNMQDKAVEAFAAENEKLCASSRRAQFISGSVMPFMNFLNNLNFVVICLYGGLSVVNGSMTFGQVQSMTQYSRQFTMPIQQIASIMNVLQSTVASAERVFELLDEPEQSPEPASPVRIEKPRGAVEFKDVSFSYSPDKPLISGMNLSVTPGSRVAIAGPTGAGKTTLVNLLMRFYEIDGGSITIDGADTRAMRREDLRDMFGMVLQDTWLFAGTVRDNIAYGREGASREDVIGAAQDASADHFIRTLEHGYETVLLDDATNISQGQRQLMTIARAFVSNPSILILDEATSSVDTRTELLIRRAMDKLMEGRTSFIIAHRLSTIRDADVILVMRDGAIVEQGSHDELMAKDGFYAELYNSQFAAQAVTGI